MAVREDGILDPEELADLPGMPSEERLAEGPVAVIECSQEIPCNPCELACPRRAIRIGKRITDLPKLDENLCIGCGLCIPACPGQAIFVVDLAYSESEAAVHLPYEFWPLPETNESVEILNRAGVPMSEGRVVRTLNPERYDHTAVVEVAVPKADAMEARNIAVRRSDSNGKIREL